MKKFFNPLFLFFICIALVFNSCKKDDDPDTTNNNGNPGNNTPTGKLMIHLHTYIDNNEVDDYGIVYTADDGRKVSLDLAQMYLSDIQLVKLDGTTVAVTDRKILKLREVETYVIGDVAVGNYKSIRFKIGLDPAMNMLNPAASADSAILNRPEMWFGNTAQPDGYVFLTLTGKIDTSADASGTIPQMQPFAYKIGTNAHYTQVNMPDKNYTVLADQVEFVHILADYYKLFNGITLNKTSNLSATTLLSNGTAPATVVANNIPQIFKYEE
jgi:hypothetical protein